MRPAQVVDWPSPSLANGLVGAVQSVAGIGMIAQRAAACIVPR